MNNARVATGKHRTILGIWQLLPSPMVSRYLARQGWQWINRDLQHGSLDARTTNECIHTIRAAGAKPIVRVSIGAASEVSKCLLPLKIAGRDGSPVRAIARPL